MEKIKLNNKKIMFIVYIIGILLVIIRIILSSIKPVTATAPPDIIQLSVTQINTLYSQIQLKSPNNYSGKPDLGQFSFGKNEPFQ